MQAYVRKLQEQMDRGTVQMSSTMQELGRQGLLKIAQMMESDEVKDELRLRAAMDLADRSPETSKTSKISVEGDLTLREGDAKRLIQALVEAATADEVFAPQVSEGDYVKVDDGTQPLLAPPESSG